MVTSSLRDKANRKSHEDTKAALVPLATNSKHPVAPTKTTTKPGTPSNAQSLADHDTERLVAKISLRHIMRAFVIRRTRKREEQMAIHSLGNEGMSNGPFMLRRRS